jgi:hypothetical protein
MRGGAWCGLADVQQPRLAAQLATSLLDCVAADAQHGRLPTWRVSAQPHVVVQQLRGSHRAVVM